MITTETPDLPKFFLKRLIDKVYLSVLFVQETSESTDLQTTLQLSMKAIQHENVDVRIHALTSLKETLYKNQVY